MVLEVGLSGPFIIYYCGLFDLNLTILELIPGCSRFVDIFTLAQKFTRQKCALQC